MTFSIEIVSLLFGVIMFIVWLVRLEGKMTINTDKIKDLTSKVMNQEEKHDALDNKIMEKLSFIERSLAKIEGQLITRRENE